MRAKAILLLLFLTCGAGFAQTKMPISVPRVQAIGEGVVWRISDNKNEYGRFLPPWKEIRIANIFGFKKRPVVGRRVTLIPLDVDIPPLELRIVKIAEKEGCDRKSPTWWDVELEPINKRIFFDIAPRHNRAEEFPFDVFVVYPAVRLAQQIKMDRLRESMLPRGVSINTVKGAIDLTRDEKPDLVIVAYCCRNPRKSADGCDYRCGKSFKKINNRWKLVDTSKPC
jgi:hypothetical protein